MSTPSPTPPTNHPNITDRRNSKGKNKRKGKGNRGNTSPGVPFVETVMSDSGSTITEATNNRTNDNPDTPITLLQRGNSPSPFAPPVPDVLPTPQPMIQPSPLPTPTLTATSLNDSINGLHDRMDQLMLHLSQVANDTRDAINIANEANQRSIVAMTPGNMSTPNSTPPDGAAMIEQPASAIKPGPELKTRGTASEVGQLEPTLMGEVESTSGSSHGPFVKMNDAVSPSSKDIIDNLRALKEEDSTQPTSSNNSHHTPILPQRFPLPYTPVPSAPVISSNGATFNYPKLYHSIRGAAPMVRKPDLLFPDHPPPGMTTHYAGRWELNPDNKRVWIQYHQTLDADELPSNVSNDPIHWLGRRYPGDQFLTINGDFIHAEGAPSSNYRRTITPHTTGLTPTTAYTETPGAGHGGDEPTSMYANVRGTPIISGTSPLQRLNKMNPNKRGDPGDFGGTGYNYTSNKDRTL